MENVEHIKKGMWLTAANKSASASGVIRFVGDWMPSEPESGYAWPAIAKTLDECYRRLAK